MEYITDLKKLGKLSSAELSELEKVAAIYPFYANEYYLSLIDWNDPNDPIKQVVVPHPKELETWGRLDPSDEHKYTIMQGLEHKYNTTALLLVSDKCAGICRYCFRKRVFMRSRECLQDLSAAMDYISAHKEITNVLLTGGDPLILPTERLEEIIGKLRRIDHVRIIRIGTRMPVYYPHRITKDASFLKMLEKHTTPRSKIYMMTHFVHPRELTDIAVEACHLIQKTGVRMTNQFPLLKGINDNSDVLANLLQELSFCGVIPYYIFQCRPAVGNKAYTIPLETGYDIIELAKSKVSGLAKRARFVMSHSTGKIEFIGKAGGSVFMKYHRAANDADSGKLLVLKNNPDACWLDDYQEITAEYPIEMPYRTYGPE